jgi:enoyl-CoA hydratase
LGNKKGTFKKMKFKTLKTGIIDEKIAEIVIHRPEKLNALNTQVLSDLCNAFDDFSRSNEVGLIILSGSGGKSFIAGADIDEMADMRPLEFREYSMKLRYLTKVMGSSPKQIIGAVKGHVFGGGNIVAMHCDFLFATENSVFGQQEINLGILGGIARLIYLVGDRRAWDIITTGRTLNAQEAERIGLITRCLAEEEFDDFVQSYARRLLAQPATAMAFAKAVKKMSEKIDLESAYEYENELTSLCFDSANSKERLQNFAARFKA